jgi:hypothetical protein
MFLHHKFGCRLWPFANSRRLPEKAQGHSKFRNVIASVFTPDQECHDAHSCIHKSSNYDRQLATAKQHCREVNRTDAQRAAGQGRVGTLLARQFHRQQPVLTHRRHGSKRLPTIDPMAVQMCSKDHNLIMTYLLKAKRTKIDQRCKPCN